MFCHVFTLPMLWRMLPFHLPEAGKAQDGYFKDRFIFQTPEKDAKVDGRCDDVRRSGVSLIKKSFFVTGAAAKYASVRRCQVLFRLG